MNSMKSMKSMIKEIHEFHEFHEIHEIHEIYKIPSDIGLMSDIESIKKYYYEIKNTACRCN